MEKLENSSSPLYPIAWGWNANGRCGNMTASELREPGHVQRTAHKRFTSCASAKHHSVLVSEVGNIYSFGEGRSDQLGLGNAITAKAAKGGLIQTFPKQVNPSGNVRYWRDFRIVQVTCGDFFTVAREFTEDEGVALCKGLAELENSLKMILLLYSECPALQRVWASLRQERFMIGRRCGGRLISWGSGSVC